MGIATLYCDACGTVNRLQARFCYSCGESLAELLSPSSVAALDILAQVRNPTDPLRAGSLLKLRYRIIAQVGQGGMGAVFRAEDTDFGNRQVAIKALNQNEGSLDAQKLVQAVNAFKQEALLLAGLMHPNLPRIYDHFCEGGRWYLAMDFIEGQTLEDHLYQTQVHYLSVEKVLEIGIQLCTTLEYLHHHQPPIIFRDLKPANVMLTPDGQLYLIDFGIARHFKAGQNKDTLVFGSVGYAAPEQYGNTQTTPRSDIYSLGAMLHQLVSGHNPSQKPFHFASIASWPAPDPSSLARLNTLIMQMVDMDASQRPASVAVIRLELHSIAAQRRNEQTNTLSLTGTSSNTSIQPSAGIAASRYSVPMLSPQTPRVFAPMGTTLLNYTGHQSRVLAVVWSPDGAYIASAGDDKLVQVWSSVSGKIVLNYSGHSEWVKAVAWSPDGRRIASAGADGVVQVWDAFTGRNILVYRGHTNVVATVAWSPNGKYIASGGYDKTVQLWHAVDGEQVFSDHSHNAIVNAVTWSPNGHYLASASDDKMVQVIQVRDADLHMQQKPFARHSIFTYFGHAGGVKAVVWSPNSLRIASGSWDNTVHVWDALTGAYVFMHKHHSSWVNAVVWSPNSTRLASASNDKTVQVWNANNGREFFTARNHFTYYGHSEWVRDVAWSPDGERIASVSHDQTVQIWQAV